MVVMKAYDTFDIPGRQFPQDKMYYLYQCLNTDFTSYSFFAQMPPEEKAKNFPNLTSLDPLFVQEADNDLGPFNMCGYDKQTNGSRSYAYRGGVAPSVVVK